MGAFGPAFGGNAISGIGGGVGPMLGSNMGGLFGGDIQGGIVRALAASLAAKAAGGGAQMPAGPQMGGGEAGQLFRPGSDGIPDLGYGENGQPLRSVSGPPNPLLSRGTSGLAGAVMQPNLGIKMGDQSAKENFIGQLFGGGGLGAPGGSGMMGLMRKYLGGIG